MHRDYSLVRLQQLAEDVCEIARRRLTRGGMLILLRFQALIELIGGYVNAVSKLLISEPHIGRDGLQPRAFDEFAWYVGGRVRNDCD